MFILAQDVGFTNKTRSALPNRHDLPPSDRLTAGGQGY
jgi:hypothetical protein